MTGIHADWRNLICLQWQLLGQRGETSPLLPRPPPSSDKQEKQRTHITSPFKRLWYSAASSATFLTFPLLQTSPTATQVSWKTKTHTSKKKNLIHSVKSWPLTPVILLLYRPCPHRFLWSRVWSHRSCTQGAFHWCLLQPARSATTNRDRQLVYTLIVRKKYFASITVRPLCKNNLESAANRGLNF